MVCEARVGAVKAQITFLTWPRSHRMPMSGAAAGRLGLLRGELSTHVRFLAPWSASAWSRLAGDPMALKPPNAITDPSGMSRTASAQVAKILLFIASPLRRPRSATVSALEPSAPAATRLPRRWPPAILRLTLTRRATEHRRERLWIRVDAGGAAPYERRQCASKAS